MTPAKPKLNPILRCIDPKATVTVFASDKWKIFSKTCVNEYNVGCGDCCWPLFIFINNIFIIIFMNIVSELMPITSDAVPLIGKYIYSV